MSDKNILEVKNLKKYFPIKSGVFQKVVGNVRAVDDVSFEINKGETFSLVGESGCGKSTLGRTVLRLLDKTSGSVKFKGLDIHSLSKKEMRKLRLKMQIIFQDPFSSLNPRKTVSDLIGEALIAHKFVNSKKEYYNRIEEVMEVCGLARYHMKRYPHEFSGGQRQRIGIARSLVLNPEFIVADEPVSALDVSIQSQIINLLQDFQEKYGFSYLFISHDLSVVRHISHKVGVLYLGSLVEVASKDDLYNSPMHPYTQALISCVPLPDPEKKVDRIILKGDIPSASNPPSGCKFHTRCLHVKDICKEEVPILKEVGNGHKVSCHLY
ncbi:ABC transporter ATP-binding protein [Candidatus Arthromitus sp. SFB-turkey]|uniref:ABC transporter ATP-binding protein n=1 Tax=Candidatus Arthromitus sp. SFB-turkey TaxID=1840217 RepID=UPI0007F546A9|nr:oligopeptide/dipeptide ABC transporter ATP-binding protein [Candidatus Arthromitus sp. SFB-turkey]OAT88017.1 peptide ABC transporter substrate-binding protein [Candidatus Arthromitus sp. SFB-turkey]HJD00910.1 ATP-binding cassette domain-containing protein [Candidatus Dwaynia gallinarum]